MEQTDNIPVKTGSQSNPIDESPVIGVQYAQVTKPEYPWRARRMGWEGTTLLRVLVDQQGRSQTIQISRSSGFENLDRAAVKAVKRWRFNPARLGTVPIETWVKIPIVFSLKDSEQNASLVNR